MEQDSINRLKYPGWGSLDELEIEIQERIESLYDSDHQPAEPALATSNGGTA